MWRDNDPRIPERERPEPGFGRVGGQTEVESGPVSDDPRDVFTRDLDLPRHGYEVLPLEAPAPLRPRRTTGRALIRTKPRRAAAAGLVGAIEDQSQDYQHPRLLLAAVIVGAGLKLLLGFALGR